MCSMLSSQGVALATVMAISGTVILLAFRLQKSSLAALFPVDEIKHSSPQILRSCISSEGKKNKNKKKNKRVHFAKDVMDPTGNGEEYRRKRSTSAICNYVHSTPQRKVKKSQNGGEGATAAAACEIKGLPANRLALYNGILRDRVVHRLAYSY